jgi:hypothetical protein
MFDLLSDGERIAFAPASQTGCMKQGQVTFIVNFFDELRRVAPATRK